MWENNFTPSLFLAMALGLVTYVIAYLIYYRRQGYSFIKLCAICAMHIYIGALFDLTQTLAWPDWSRVSGGTVWYAFKNISWSPIAETRQIWHNASNYNNMPEFYRIIGGNFVMLMPLGLLLPVIKPHFRFRHMLAVALVVPLIIETMQLIGNMLLISGRDVSMNDYVLNALGCILAYLVFAFFRRIYWLLTRKKRRYRRKYDFR